MPLLLTNKVHSFSNTSDGAATLFEKIAPCISELEIGMESDVSSLAKTSFRITFCVDRFSFQLKLLIQQIILLRTRFQMSELLKKINTTITTTSGIGDVLAVTILGEVGDINHFNNGTKLVAYADIDV